MQEIEIKGIYQVFVYNNETIPDKILIDDRVRNVYSISSFMQGYIHKLENVRRVIVPVSKFTRVAVLHYAWFTNNMIPIRIEEMLKSKKLMQNELDKFFSQSAFLQYQVTCCIKGCKESYHTLILPRFLSQFTTTPEIEKTKHLNMFNILNCPNCNREFGQNVVKILQKVSKIF